jgi:nucleoside-diphosphate-sugar epimerase
MKISGFIGTHLKNRLKSDGHHVIGMNRNLLYEPVLLHEFFIREKPETIYHLAAYGNHYNQTDDYKCIRANILALNNLLDEITCHQVKMFYNFSSSSVDLDYQTFYSATKASGELLCKAYINKYNLPIKTIKPYSIYGPGEANFRFIPSVIFSLLNKSEMIIDMYAVHDWIFIDDFIDALINGYTEIGSGIGLRNCYIIELLEKISCKKLNYTEPSKPLRKYDNEHWFCDDSVPQKYSLEQGLKKTFEYYEKHGFKKENS